jgi:hypothetical protein
LYGGFPGAVIGPSGSFDWIPPTCGAAMTSMFPFGRVLTPTRIPLPASADAATVKIAIAAMSVAVRFFMGISFAPEIGPVIERCIKCGLTGTSAEIPDLLQEIF